MEAQTQEGYIMETDLAMYGGRKCKRKKRIVVHGKGAGKQSSLLGGRDEIQAL